MNCNKGYNKVIIVNQWHQFLVKSLNRNLFYNTLSRQEVLTVEISKIVFNTERTAEEKQELIILVNKHFLLQKNISLVLKKYDKETFNEKSYSFTRQTVKAKQAKNAKLSLERQLQKLKEEIHILENEISKIDSGVLDQILKSK